MGVTRTRVITGRRSGSALVTMAAITADIMAATTVTTDITIIITTAFITGFIVASTVVFTHPARFHMALPFPAQPVSMVAVAECTVDIAKAELQSSCG